MLRMSEFKRRLTNYRFFLIFSILVISCYKAPDLALIEPVPQPTFDTLVTEFALCRGDGVIVSKGLISGNLKFRYTTTVDQTFLEFKDMLGRTVIEIQLNGNSILAFDVLRKQKYSHQQLVSIMPILEVFSANDLRSTLWGIEPEVPDSSVQGIIESMHVESEITPYGLLVSRIDAQSKDKTQKMVIQIINREFGISYPELEKRLTNHG